MGGKERDVFERPPTESRVRPTVDVVCLEQLARLQVGRQRGQMGTQLRLVTKAVGLLSHTQAAGE